MSQVLVCDRPVTGLSRGHHTNRNCATPQIEAPNLQQNLQGNHTDFSELNWWPPLCTILKETDRQKGLIKNLNNSSAFLSIRGRMIGMISSPSWNSSTIIISIPQLRMSPSSYILAGLLAWDSNQTNIHLM